MKITYNYNEACEALKHNHAGNVEVSIDIASLSTPQTLPTCNIHEMLKIVRSFLYHTGSEKLAAIKAIREYAKQANFYLPLAEAKWFVENV